MKTSVKQDNEKRWAVTGDDGMSPFRLNVLRVMTVALFSLTLCFLMIVLDVFNLSGATTRLKAMQIVVAVVLCFIGSGLGVALGIHPLMGSRSKALLFSLFCFGGLGSYQYSLAEKLNVSPFLIVPGLPLGIASIAFIPLTYAAWTSPPLETDD